jgi:hypothetical protein
MGLNPRATESSTADESYLDAPYLSIRWRGVPHILYAEWKGFATSAEFRAALLTGVRAIREHNVVGYVSDARRAKVFLAEDMMWVKEVWLPQAVGAGLKRMAMVTAESGIGKALIEHITEEINDHGLAMRKFNSIPAATTWALTGLIEPGIA